MGKKIWSNNEAVEMMQRNNATSFRKVADYAKDSKMCASEIIDFLIECSNEMEAQAQVVSLRDELNIKSEEEI